MARFSVNVDDFADKTPILPAGVYSGELAKCTITGKENKQYIRIEKKVEWVNKQRVETDDYVLSGFMMLGAVLTDDKAREILLEDEPLVFGMVSLKFNQDTGLLEMKHNVALKQLLTTLEVDFNSIQADAESSIDFDSLEIPEELLGVPNIAELYPAMVFHREAFTMLCNTINGNPVRVSIIQRPNRQNKAVMEHAIDNGTPSAPFCGFLPFLG
jgi:hypothetical protein